MAPKFLGDRSIFISIEVTLGGFLDKGQSLALISSLELSVHPHPLEKGEGLYIELQEHL